MKVSGSVNDCHGTPHAIVIDGGMVLIDGKEVTNWVDRRELLGAIGLIERVCGTIALTQPGPVIAHPYSTRVLSEGVRTNTMKDYPSVDSGLVKPAALRRKKYKGANGKTYNGPLGTDVTVRDPAPKWSELLASIASKTKE